MENYKVKVGSEAESKEVQELFFELGYVWSWNGEANIELFNFNPITLNSYNDMTLTQGSFLNEDHKEITIPQLKDIVVLKRNYVGDATHKNKLTNSDYYVSSDSTVYFFDVDKEFSWKTSNYRLSDLKPITKEPIMKEFLNPDQGYKLVCCAIGETPIPENWIEVPEGATSYNQYTRGDGDNELFIKLVGDTYGFANKDTSYTWEWYGGSLKGHEFFLWQRETQSEALPFIDDEPKYDPEDIGIAKGYDLDELAKEYKLRDRCDGETDEEYRYMLKHYIDLENYIAKETLNDKVASAEVARQEFITPFDTQISGDHYKLLPIQPMKFALANGLDYAQGNVIKYVIRHASKNGKDDLLKAIHNIELMIEHYYGDH